MSVVPSRTIKERLEECTRWPARFSQEEWTTYKAVMTEARRREIPFAIGGALAAMTYAGQWRNTKDLDVYVRERDRDAMIHLLTELGLEDYYAKQPYDRKWIYRSHSGDIIVDLIWAMANQRAVVKDSWLAGPLVEAGGEQFHLLPPEEALWSKLYVFQHDRSDWPDALNLLFGVGPEINWRRLLDALGPDVPLLAGLLAVFGWLCPQQARELPFWLWQELGVSRPAPGADPDLVRSHASLLDSRPWFGPTLDEHCAPLSRD